MNKELMFSSKSEDWETPQDFFDSLNQEFHFSLDAAASDSNAKCPIYFTKRENALLKNWGGTLCFVILRMVERLGLLSKRLMKNQKSQTHLSLCFSQHGQTRNGFMSTFLASPKSGLYVVGLNSETLSILPRFRVWLSFTGKERCNG